MAGGTRIGQYGQKTSNRNQIKQGYYAYQIRAAKYKNLNVVLIPLFIDI
ncbi:hypothetical protein VCRA2119O147_1750005 [Vibrio crassostreae]|uniref:Uncharacterized protein n=2 Tax=Vibrio TaxID=662 RepID=A0AA86XCX2_9VIBR|nr:hypothetical protein VCHA50P424_220036 [Vibrio chagasii]CAK1994193.1 hypothetical protein VCRA2119O46_280038 [Vibrio crassostreae]CDT86743.1 hypothetical protein VCR31J2_1370036 [Vibrio coralliirubri]CAH7188042.1 hypothetical protein VCHA50O407_290024 [Vibrio chagasii]CAK2044665.1 hypothetical protein VCRA2112O189_310022 [Vibrio crassostreae]